MSIGVDSTTAPHSSIGRLALAAGGYDSTSCRIDCYPGVGFHYLQQLEYSEASAGTWYGTASEGSWMTARVLA
jgi:hypothetical protein